MTLEDIMGDAIREATRKLATAQENLVKKLLGELTTIDTRVRGEEYLRRNYHWQYIVEHKDSGDFVLKAKLVRTIIFEEEG